jgi:ATP-dependent DNA ligase
VEDYFASDEWVFEQKLDGIRAICKVSYQIAAFRHGNVVSFARHDGVALKSSAAMQHFKKITEQLADVQMSVALDGEIMTEDGSYRVFDILFLGDNDLRGMPHSQRRVVLEAWFSANMEGNPLISLVPQSRTEEEKRRLWGIITQQKLEGVMLKHLSGRLDTGKPSKRANSCLKCKFTQSIDCIVVDKTVDPFSVTLALVVPKTGTYNRLRWSLYMKEVGKSSLIGKGTVNEGDVVEVEFLYCLDTENPRLYQPRIKRVRQDKTREECTIDQLDGSFTEKKVVS